MRLPPKQAEPRRVGGMSGVVEKLEQSLSVTRLSRQVLEAMGRFKRME